MSEVSKNAPKTPADIAAELDIVDRLEDAELTLQKERKALELSRAKLNLLEKYTREKTTKTLKLEAERKRTEELGKKEAWLLEKSKATRLEQQIAACRILAPRDGSVVYANDPVRGRVNGRPQIEEGSTVRLRQKIASVVDLAGPMVARVKVSESRVDVVTPGMRAAITVDSFPDSTLPGTVVNVAPLPDPVAMADWDNKVYTTKVRLDEAMPGLRPGMTARAEIKVSSLGNVLALPNRAVIRLDGKDQVAAQRPDGSFEWRIITLGLSSETMTEVLSGIKSGDRVALQPASFLTEAQKQQVAASPTAPAGATRGSTAPARRSRGH